MNIVRDEHCTTIYALRQIVPCEPSSSTMPAAFNSSRRQSADFCFGLLVAEASGRRRLQENLRIPQQQSQYAAEPFELQGKG